MVLKDDLGNRMKTYEQTSQTNLLRRMPVVIRLDGKAFHTFTKGFKKPFDEFFWNTMRETTKYLCENIQNCVLGYCQSDEITLVLVDYYELNTDVWFKNNIQKLCSISASMCTYYFNLSLLHFKDMLVLKQNMNIDEPVNNETIKFINSKIIKGAIFDSRCFNIPREDVTNCLLWRQKDCYRNSISSVAQTLYTHKELQNKNSKDKLQMIADKGFDWDGLNEMYKLGTFVLKDENGVFQYRSFDVIENRKELDQLFLAD